MTTHSNEDKINQLVDAALASMEHIDSTSSELLSAVFTLTLRTVQAVLAVAPQNRSTVQQAIHVLLLECADRARPN